ncbi:MAG: hypothetical protein IJ735_00860 [Clostridia bacterium]|nr:hypothetical protein [Clostridia bacterium]
MGQKMVEDNLYSNAADFGIFVFSEAGKDRGNQYDHMRIVPGSFTVKNVRKILKKYEKSEYVGMEDLRAEFAKLEEDPCSPLNDYFNLMLKMFRHLATVDGVCFVSMFMNDQREQCLNADARELCDVVTLTKKSRVRNVLPFNVYDEIVRDAVYYPFRKVYDKLRVLRGDNTLLIHILKSITSAFERRYVRLRNEFDYFSVSYTREDGKMETRAADKERGKIYICSKLAFSRRYSTDCFGGYFERRSAQSAVGLGDVETFGSEKATWEELDATHGHFIKTLKKTIEEDDD